MTLAVLFWVLYIVSLIFGIWAHYEPGQPFPLNKWGGSFLHFVLIGILGWAKFGGPIQ